jgi:hypothetical protein
MRGADLAKIQEKKVRWRGNFRRKAPGTMPTCNKTKRGVLVGVIGVSVSGREISTSRNISILVWIQSEKGGILC